MLYTDCFYEQLPMQESLYLPSSPCSKEEQEELRKQGVTSFLIGDQTFLTGRKQQLEAIGPWLKTHIPMAYEVPIAYPVKMTRHQLQAIKEEKPNWEGLQEQCYIGILGTEAVTRQADIYHMACCWQQQYANQGTYQTQFMYSNEEQDTVKTTELDLVMKLVGAFYREQISALNLKRLKPQFITAQLQSVSNTIQRSYSPTPISGKVSLVDLLIGARQLLHVARANGKYLILVIPYIWQLSQHTGTGMYERLWAWLTHQPDCLCLVPTGEEGDKGHHITQSLKEGFQAVLTLPQAECVQGKYFFKQIPRSAMYVANNHMLKKQEAINLAIPGFYQRQNYGLISLGWQEELTTSTISWQIIANKPMKWLFEMLPSERVCGQVDLWLEPNVRQKSVTCLPNTYTMSMNALASCEGMLSIGSLHKATGITLGATGRGSTSCGIYPDCVSDGSYQGLLGTFSGTMVATARVAASLMLLLTHFKYFPSHTPILKQHLPYYLSHTQLMTYPHEAQGYGIFDPMTVWQLVSKEKKGRGDDD